MNEAIGVIIKFLFFSKIDFGSLLCDHSIGRLVLLFVALVLQKIVLFKLESFFR